MSDPREEETNHITFREIKWTIDSDAERTITAIQNATAKLTRRLEERIRIAKEQESADINVATIRRRRETERLRAHIWGEEFTAGPIKTLPAEMLSEIFRHYVESDLSPWALVKVCRRWMHTALRTPRLWGHIQFINKKWITDAESWIFDGSRKFSRGNVQICNTPAQVNDALSRSGATPLEVSIQLYDDEHKCTYIPSVIASLVTEPTSCRIQSLEIASAEVAGAFLVPGRFPLLKNIYWRGPVLPWTHQLFAMISGTSNHLEHAKVCCTLTSQLLGLPFWSRIKTVALMQLDPSGMAQDLNKVAPNLKSLEGHFRGPYEWPNIYTSAVNWPKIRSLSLQCCPVELQHLHVPRLELLELDEPQFGRNIRPYRELIFPSLTTLKLTTSDARWLSRVSLPRLTTLDIDCHWTHSSEDTSFIFRSLSLLTVQALTLGPKWNDTAVVAALESVPNLLILRLMGTIRTYNCRIEVLKRLGGGLQPDICPRLESLFLGDAAWPVYTLKTRMVPTIKWLIKIRQWMKTPIQKLVVCWGVETESVEEIFI